MRELVDAKAKLGPDEALELARAASEIIVAKGTKITRFVMKEGPSDDELLAVMLGPTGNLRAPVLRVGKRLFVGFPKEGFEELR